MRRLAALGVLGAVVVAVAWIVLSSGREVTYRLLFQNAGQLVPGDEVRVGGIKAGSVKDIELTSDNQARVTIGVDGDYAPLHEGTTAVIRATSLSGVANRYVSITAGPDFRPALHDGAVLTGDSTTSIVDLDQLFDALNPPTRRAVRQIVQGSATQYQGKERLANLSARYFNPALSSTTRLMREIDRDNATFSEFILNTSQLVSTIAARRDDLAELVANSSTTAGAIGSQNRAFARSLAELPRALRQGNSTFVDLRAALGDLDRLVAAARPATRPLAPFLTRLRPVVAEAVPTFTRLRRIVRRPGPGNDLRDLLGELPRLASVGDRAFPRATETLRRARPVIEFIRPYAPDTAGLLRDFGQSTAYYDANGHYARVQPIFDAFDFTDNPAGGSLSPKLPDRRGASPNLILGNLRRCPGSAAAPPADGSAPFVDQGADANADCDPGQRPVGP